MLEYKRTKIGESSKGMKERGSRIEVPLVATTWKTCFRTKRKVITLTTSQGRTHPTVYHEFKFCLFKAVPHGFLQQVGVATFHFSSFHHLCTNEDCSCAVFFKLLLILLNSSDFLNKIEYYVSLWATTEPNMAKIYIVQFGSYFASPDMLET